MLWIMLLSGVVLLLWLKISEAVIYIFCVYGFLCFLLELFIRIKTFRQKGSEPDLYIVINNGNKNAEGMVRSLLSGGLLERQLPGVRLHIVNIDEDNETAAVLKKLAEKYEGRFDLVDCTGSTLNISGRK